MSARDDEEPNYLLEAFRNQYNLIGLGTAIGFAILSGSFLPMLIAAGAELALLPFMERWERYQRARNLGKERDQRRRLEASEMLQALGDEERRRYRQLEGMAAEIRQNYKVLDTSSRILLDELESKLEFLLAFYLRMRYSVTRYQAYFASTDPDQIQRRIAALEREMARGPERIQAIKARTRAVLLKRSERYQKAIENKQLVDAQTETVEEVLQLLRDQSYSMRDPRSIAEQLDGLVASAEETERGVKDMEDILEAERDVLMPLGLGTAAELEAPAATPVARAAPPPRVRPPAVTSSPPPPPRNKLTH